MPVPGQVQDPLPIHARAPIVQQMPIPNEPRGSTCLAVIDGKLVTHRVRVLLV